MANLDELHQYKNIHMIGIGGTSMSGIAEILRNWNFNVTGSDLNESENTDKLIKHGVKVTIGHDIQSVSRADVVIYSAAVPNADIELQKAKELHIPTIERADFLGMITKAFEDTICISGTHGKSTTTSMIAICFLEACKDPSVQVGAILKQLNGNYRVGNSEYFIMEACEYVESFLKFHPTTEVILNIDNDHLDYFENLDNIKASFAKYVKLLPENGLLVLNADDENCSHLSRFTNAKTLTYGIQNQHANFVARNIVFDKNGFASFDAYFNDTFYKTVKLSVPGLHNVLNALATIAVCHSYGIEREDIKNGLLKFTGAHRRFEYVGSFNGVNVYDDYGHHPTEIQAVADAMKNKKYNKSWVIFQPHTYSRTKTLLKDFAKALTNFDNIIITDIYAAREKNTYEISSRDLATEVANLGKKAYYIPEFSEIVNFVHQNAISGDIVLTQGAGTITQIGPMLCK